jgi:inhibitor of cysteine peptidase
MSAVVLTKANNGESIKVQLGDEIVLRLAENATTGYRWHIVRAEGLVEDETQQPGHSAAPDPNPFIGGGGLREFRFRPSVAGSGRLELKYWREWEGDSSVADRFSVDLERPPVK